jgi:hypothetical protein
MGESGGKLVDQIAGGNHKTFGDHRKRKTGQKERLGRKKNTGTTERRKTGKG